LSAPAPAVATASTPLRVLRVGAGAGRAPVGVLERVWRSLDIELPSALAQRPLAAIAQGLARIDTSAIAWADVVVLGLPFATIPVCLDCGLTEPDGGDPIEHAREAGHTWRRPTDEVVRGLVLAGERDPGLWRGRGIVVELHGDPMAGAPDVERDLVGRLIRMADRVIASSAAAAAAARREGAGQDRIMTVGDGPTGPVTRLEALRLAAAASDPGRLARRLAIRAADAEAAARLAARQAVGLPAWDPADADDPLVSVVILVADEPVDIVERAISSALACPGVRLEVVVAGAPGSAAMTAVVAGGEARVRRVPVAVGPPAHAFAAAVDAAAGAWIAPLDPWSLLVEEHPKTLLEVVREYGLDAVYAQTLLVAAGEPTGLVGAWPPARDALARDASLFSAALRDFRPDSDAEDDGHDPCWNLWSRWMEAGARLASIDGPLALHEVPPPVPVSVGVTR